MWEIELPEDLLPHEILDGSVNTPEHQDFIKNRINAAA